MPFFQNNKENLLTMVKENPFKIEKDLQKMFERNLELLMGLEFVSTEYSVKNRRIDTLAFDNQTKSFVIIEYKRDRGTSVVDQGYAYLGIMLDNKSDFILEYQERTHKKLNRDQVDWSQSKVVFVASDFTEMQIEANNFIDIPFELWEVKRYENNMLSVSVVKKSKSAGSIKTFSSKDKRLKDITDVIKVYTEDDLLSRSSDEIAALYYRFKESILNLRDGIDVVCRKLYVSFKNESKHNICDIEIFSKSIILFINLPIGKLDDPRKIAEDCSNKGHHGNGDYQIKIHDDSNLEYIMSLVKQAFL